MKFKPAFNLNAVIISTFGDRTTFYQVKNDKGRFFIADSCDYVMKSRSPADVIFVDAGGLHVLPEGDWIIEFNGTYVTDVQVNKPHSSSELPSSDEAMISLVSFIKYFENQKAIPEAAPNEIRNYYLVKTDKFVNISLLDTHYFMREEPIKRPIYEYSPEHELPNGSWNIKTMNGLIYGEVRGNLGPVSIPEETETEKSAEKSKPSKPLELFELLAEFEHECHIPPAAPNKVRVFIIDKHDQYTEFSCPGLGYSLVVKTPEKGNLSKPIFGSAYDFADGRWIVTTYNGAIRWKGRADVVVSHLPEAEDHQDYPLEYLVKNAFSIIGPITVTPECEILDLDFVLQVTDNLFTLSSELLPEPVISKNKPKESKLFWGKTGLILKPGTWTIKTKNKEIESVGRLV